MDKEADAHGGVNVQHLLQLLANAHLRSAADGSHTTHQDTVVQQHLQPSHAAFTKGPALQTKTSYI